MLSWIVSWIMMLPAVLFAAPAIQFVAVHLTRDDGGNGRMNSAP
jgi:hypothetical protein